MECSGDEVLDGDVDDSSVVLSVACQVLAETLVEAEFVDTLWSVDDVDKDPVDVISDDCVFVDWDSCVDCVSLKEVVAVGVVVSDVSEYVDVDSVCVVPAVD